MKSLGRLSLIALMALSIGFTANAKSQGHKKASQYLSATAKHSKNKKSREVASAKHKKKKKKGKKHHRY